MDSITAIVHACTKPRLKEIEHYAFHAEELQEKQLQNVITQIHGTEYARHHGFSGKSYKDFCRLLPVTDYEPLHPYIERMLRGESGILVPGVCYRFAKSSGTSGSRSKFIPVTKRHLQRCHFRGASDALFLYLGTRPDSRFFGTKGLVLGGSSRPVANDKKILQGDLSSILVEKMPWLGNMLRVPKKSILLMDEWNEKMRRIVDQVIHENVGSLSGVPSWMLVMIKEVLQKTRKSDLSQVWPSLEVFFHGGISFEPYRAEYERLIPSERMQYRETYNASEGFFGIQDDPRDSSLLLMLDYGIFYEFIPLEELDSPHPKAVPLSQVEVGKVYSMVISTLGGLYRYQIGDTVSFTSTKPYKFRIVGRTSHYINAFGEELMVANTDKAISIVTQRLHCQVSEYTAAPLLMPEAGKGRHQWIVEFYTPPEDLHLFADELDRELRELNSDYDAKRYSDMTLLPLEIFVAPKGFFSEYLAKEGKLGGQHKVPRLRNSRDLFEKLLKQLPTSELP